MKNKGIEDFNKIYVETIREFAEEKFAINGGFDIEKLFDYESVNFIDMYEPRVLRSTKKEASYEFTPIEDDKDLVSTEEFKDMLNDFGLNGITKDDYKKRFTPEMKDSYLRRYLHTLFLMWDDNYKSYEYDKEIVDQIDNVDFEASNLKDNVDYFLSTLKVEFNYHGNERFQLEPQTDETGYVIPEYPLLKMQLDYISIEETYRKIVKDFKLEKDYGLSKVSELGTYRDLIEKQLQRQLVQLNKFNEQIKNFLIFFYKALEVSLLHLHGSKTSEDKDDTAPKDWFFCLNMFKAIYDTFYMNFTEDNLMKFHCNELNRNPYLPEDTRQALCELIDLSYQKKKPVIIVARGIALKLRVVETIIEGMIIDNSLKNLNDVVETLTYSDLPSPINVAKKFVTRKGNKRRKYGVLIVEPIMRATREYIVANNVEDMFGDVATVAGAEEFDDYPASQKSRENYVRFYAIEAGRYKERENEDKEASKSDSSTKNS